MLMKSLGVGEGGVDEELVGVRRCWGVEGGAGGVDEELVGGRWCLWRG